MKNYFWVSEVSNFISMHFNDWSSTMHFLSFWFYFCKIRFFVRPFEVVLIRSSFFEPFQGTIPNLNFKILLELSSFISSKAFNWWNNFKWFQTNTKRKIALTIIYRIYFLIFETKQKCLSWKWIGHIIKSDIEICICRQNLSKFRNW